MQRVAAIALGVGLLCGQCALALDPSLDISQYAHTSWKIRDGVIRGRTTSMAQTPDGYLWLGTEFGLFRFDGVRPVAWRPAGGEQLASNYIRDLLVARDGTLWIATENGLGSWGNGKLTLYPELAGQSVLSLLQDREGTVWVGVSQPGRLCAIRGGKTGCEGAGSFGARASLLYENRNGGLWVADQTGVWRWAPGHSLHYELPAHQFADTLIEDDTGAVLLGSAGGLQQLVGGKLQSYPVPGVTGQFMPTRLFRSSDGGLWVGTREGLWRLKHGKADRFALADGLSGDYVLRIFEDREANIWVSTQDGLDRFREFAIPTFSVSQGLASSSVMALQATPDGSIWIDTMNESNRWKNGDVTIYPQSDVPGQSQQERAGGRPRGRDDRGRLWAATNDDVSYLEDGRIVKVPGVPGGVRVSVAGDGHGNVWILNGDEHVLHFWTPDGVVKQFKLPGAKQGYGPVSLLPDPIRGGVWLGYFEGGVAYLEDGKVRASYNTVDGLGGGQVAQLQPGSDGAVWAATEGGLSQVKDARVATLTSRNGLPCDALHWVMEDNDHSFWLYMPCGLVRIAHAELEAWVKDSKRAVRTTVFDSLDGVRTIRGYGVYGPHPGPNVTKAPDGKIWFLAGDGVSVIDPRHLPVNKIPPPVHIEQITANGKTYDASQGLRLSPGVHDLAIEYTALSLAAPAKVHFRFKLDSQDGNWREVVNQRRVEYSNLPPGNYRFRVVASNNSGVWNEAGDSLDFSIAPAYYQTAWFRVSCVAVFFALLWTLYRYRLHQVAREFNAALEGRVDERTRIARELHDTLLQSFQGLMLRFQAAFNELPARPSEAREALGSALDYAAQAIMEGRDAVQGLRSSTVETNDLALALTALGEQLAASETNGDGVESFVGVEGTPRDLHPILRDDIYRIAAEAMRNAFRHAQARRMEVAIGYGQRQFVLGVRDDGKGIDPEVLGEQGRPGHWGLAGMRERAELIGGHLEVSSELQSGTEVKLSIPASLVYATSPARRRSRLFARKTGTNP